MSRPIILAGICFSLLVSLPSLAPAQEGFALKLGVAFNSSEVEDADTDLRLSDAAGWSIGAEYALPLGVTIGLSGYTAGSPDAFDTSEGSLVFLADANYFLRLPSVPISAYGGLHVGLGTYRLDEIESARPEVDFGDRGYQFGLRFQPTSLIGLDAQYRRVSGSLTNEQGSDFERDQFLLSVALF